MRPLHPVLACLAFVAATAAAQAPRKPDLEAVGKAVLAGTNALRAENDLPPLSHDPQLDRAAEGFARFMAAKDEYGHEADGRTPTQRARAAGYRDCMVAENIAYQMRTRGFETRDLAERFVTGWANSPGHRRNMLDPAAVQIGIAVAYSEETSRYYGVQLFGRPETMRIAFDIRNESRNPARYRVGDKDFTLQGRSERQHLVCGDVRVVFERGSGDRAFKPEAGERFTITPAGKLERLSRRD